VDLLLSCATAAALLSVVLPRSLAGQQVDRSTVGVSVRVNVCAGTPADVRAGTRTGQFLWRDSATIMLTTHGQNEAIPLSRVRSVDLMTRRSRELETLGVVVGMVGGVYVLSLLVSGSPHLREADGAVLLAIPLSVIIGGSAGYFVGSKLSGHEEWQPLPLPPGYGAACGRH
jgi:hypothetical protein